MSDRWTVRGIDASIIAMLRDVSEVSGVTFGELLSAAVTLWYRQLPEVGDDADEDNRDETAAAFTLAEAYTIRVAEAHIGLFCGRIIGEYLEKLVDLQHPKDRAIKLIAYIMGAFEQVTVTTKFAPHAPSDPDDEVFILCAIDGNADYLVSEDKSLLDLTPHYQKPVIGHSEQLAAIFGS
jgi:hypothetical protein